MAGERDTPDVVLEASRTYEPSMRNVAAADASGVCRVCRTFIAPEYSHCRRCNAINDNLDVLVPISYSEHHGPLHNALRAYKGPGGLYAYQRIGAILWRFLEEHEACVAVAGGVSAFDTVTVVPSSRAADDERSKLRQIVERIEPTASRFERVLKTTDKESDRIYDPFRYEATEALSGRSVLLIDDTWTTGAHAQSAASCLRSAGATSVSAVVIGRHMQPEWKPDPEGEATTADLLKELPPFSWDTCAVHGAAMRPDDEAPF